MITYARRNGHILTEGEKNTMKASQVKDMPVVSMADGTKIGNVQDVLIDTAKLRLAALVLSGPGGKSLLPFASVRSFGADVITVESASVTQGIEGHGAVESRRSLRELTNLRVINGEGTHLGDLKDLEVGADGQVTELAAHRGGLLGMGGASVTVPASAVRGVGPKIITVDMPVAGAVTPPAASTPPTSPPNHA